MLKAVLESLDDVQEAHQSLYQQVDDHFILQIEDADSLPDVKNLKSAYEAEKAKRVKLAQERDVAQSNAPEIPDDFDLEVWNKAKSGEVDQAAIEAATIKLRKTLEGERDEWKGKYDENVMQGRKTTADMQLTDALTKAGVKDAAFLEAGRAMLSPKVNFDDDGNPRVNSDMGPMPINEYVERWSKTDGKAFVTPAKGGGPGTSTPPIGGASKKAQDLAAKIPALASLPPS